MKHQRPSLNMALILALALLAACNAPVMSPTSAPTKTPEATLEPTAVPVIVITPIPLPTTVPNQVELIKKATKNHPVDFVIDTQQLKGGVVPFWFRSLDTWYKYTSPDGVFSILMHGGLAPQETTLDGRQGMYPPGTKVVKDDYLLLDYQAVTYFKDPALTTRELTPEQLLNSFDVAQFMSTTHEIKTISDTRLQLSRFPGRDMLLQTTSKDRPDMKMEVHVRFYVVGNTIYQLTYLGSGKLDPEIEARFLNSFTVHDMAP